MINDDTTEKVECSVLVCTYRPVWDKLRLTLKSILMQESCNIKIIVTDDGSNENHFAKVRAYMAEHSFMNYELVSSTKNYGTVRNIQQGMDYCEGEFVKLISPGDFLHGRYVLREWIDFMHEHNDCILSFCDAIYYHRENGNITATREFAHPQWACEFKEGTPLQEYLLCNDTVSGAATMLKREAWIVYLEMIVGKIIYTEDYAYRLMMYRGEKISHIPKNFLLYEFGTGISTCGNDLWNERIRNDFKVSNDIIRTLKPCDEAKRLRIKDFVKIPVNRAWKNRLRRFQFAPIRIIHRIKTKCFPRMTPIEMDTEFVRDLLN